MLRLARQPRLRCAARLAAALLCFATINAWALPCRVANAEESIGRFPERTAAVELPPAIVESPLFVEGVPPESRDSWPDQPPSNVDGFEVAPPTCACPDCGGLQGDRSLLNHFSDWDTADYFMHDNPDDPARHVGKGEPLFGTSWLNRPHYTGVLLGGVVASGPLDPWAEHENSGLLSLYQGYDFDHFWGGEMRLAVGRFGLAGETEETNDVYYIDAHLSYYPWGDARFRPYLSGGIGFMGNDFVDSRGLEFNELLLTFPLALGMKYQMQPHYAIRFDLTQNISFGSGSLDTMDNISLSAGVEWHYGGPRKSYFPWNAGIYEH